MHQQPEATEEVAIVVKAVPQPSKKYGETACCAGITRQGEWRRLYPIRFRHLKDNAFDRWQWVQCRTAWRSTDRRTESGRVSEDSIVPLGMLKPAERPGFIRPLIRESVICCRRRRSEPDANPTARKSILMVPSEAKGGRC